MVSSPLPRRISLCPLNDPYPSDNDQVTTYHCAIHSFTEGSPLCSAEATGYTRVRATPRLIDFVRSEHLHGSSRGWCGVVVDRRGRAVGLICSGVVPGVQLLPLPDAFQTVWATVTAEGRDMR